MKKKFWVLMVVVLTSIFVQIQFLNIAYAYTDTSNMSDADFFSKINLDYPGLETVKSDVNNSDYASAKTHLLDYFQGRTVPKFYYNYTTSTKAYAITSTANELVSGYYEINNSESNDFSSGFDWTESAWTNLSYHHYLLDFQMFSTLIGAWLADTTNTSYPDHWMDASLAFINDQGNTSPGYENMLDTAKRLSSWTGAYSVFKDSSAIDASGNTGYLKYLWQMADYLYDNIPLEGNNWVASEARSLYVAGVYFPEFKDSSFWRLKGQDRMNMYQLDKIKGDGHSDEPTENYHLYGVSLAQIMMEMGNINGYSNILPSVGAKLERANEFIMDMEFPNYEEPMIGDSYANISVGDTLKAYASIYDRDDFMYIGSEGATGTMPSHESSLYANSTAIMRSGWTTNDKYLFIENEDTGYNASHSHKDDLSIVMAAYGKRLIADPGIYTYDTSDSISNWLRYSTEAHNTIEVDDTAQGDGLTNRKNSDWISNDGFDFYNGQHEDYANLIHKRKVLFVKPDYWIVSDIITGSSTTKKYEQAWHFMPTTLTLDGTTKRVNTSYTNEANVKIVPADPTSITATLKDGYYSGTYGSYQDAKYATYVKNISGDVTFDTVLYPESSTSNKDVRVTRLTMSGVGTSTATALKVDTDYGTGNIGYYYLSHESNPTASRTFDIYTYNGELAYIEKTNGGSLVSTNIKNGSYLKDITNNLIYSSGILTDLSVKYNGSTLELFSSESLKEKIKIYAPSVTTVKFNGSTISYTTSGNYITVTGSRVTLFDDFEDGDSTGWTVVSGTWAVDTDGTYVYHQTDNSVSSATVRIGETSLYNYEVETNIKVNSWGSTWAGINMQLRRTNSDNFYEFQIYQNGGSPVVNIVRRADGTNTTLVSNSYTLSTGTWYKVKASAQGGSLKLFINDVEVASVNDFTLTKGQIGLVAHRANAVFDNVRIYKDEMPDGTVDYSNDFSESIYVDHFMYGFDNGGEMGWKELVGTWTIDTQGSTDIYRHDNETASDSFVIRGEKSWSDTRVKADFYTYATYSNYNGLGVIARYKDSSNYYQFRYYIEGGTGKLQIVKVLGGSSTVLATKNYTLNNSTWYTMVGEVNGTSLKLIIDGTEHLSTTDSSLRYGKVGLWAHKRDAWFDNVDIKVSYNWDFEDSVDNDWTAITGTWAVYDQSGNKVYRQSVSSTTDAQVFNTTYGWKDYTIEANLFTSATGSSYNGIGIYARYQDPNNYYLFRYYSNGGTNPELQIVKLVGGSSTILATKSFTMNNNQWYTVKALLSGSNLVLYVDGTEQIRTTDHDLFSGCFGFNAHKRDARFDDIKLSPIITDEWINDEGVWIFSNGKITADNKTSSNSQITTVEQNDYDNAIYEANIKVTEWGTTPASVGIVARSLDDNDGYRFIYYNGGSGNTKLKIERVMSGQIAEATPVTLAETSFTLNTNTQYEFKAIAEGGFLRFYVDGNLQLKAYDPMFKKGGMSLRASNVKAEFDNVRILSITEPTESYILSFSNYDSRPVTTLGYHFKQVLIDGKVVWEKDIAADNYGWFDVEVDVNSHLQGKDTVKLELRLYEKQGVANYSTDLYWDEVLITNATLSNGGFESSSDWTYSEQNSAFEGANSTSYAKAGTRSFKISFPSNTTSSVGDYGSIVQLIVP